EGRACAVGYLMIESGWRDVAESIATSSNNAFLTEIDHPGAIAWIAQSGLTLEECAMIQPLYGRAWPMRFIELPLDNCSKRGGGPVRVLVNQGDCALPLVRGYTEVVLGAFDASAVRMTPGFLPGRVASRPVDPENPVPSGVVITWDMGCSDRGGYELS